VRAHYVRKFDPYFQKKLTKKMKASIIISGQIHGNFTLKAHLQTIDTIKVINLPFSSFRICFSTVKEAKQALKEAYMDLKDQCTSVSYNKWSATLDYDASSAKLVKGI